MTAAPARFAAHSWRAALATLVLAGALNAPAIGEAPPALKASDIEAVLVGKTFRATTRRVPVGDPDYPTGMVTRSDGAYANIDIFVRPDRSIIFRCTMHRRDGTSTACSGGGYARDVGVWSIEGDQFCYQFTTSRGGRKQCYAVLRDGADLRFRLASGPPSSIDGERLVQR